MISLNFTLLVQFSLFLLFLWGTNRFVFRPLLRLMDTRVNKVEGDKTAAEADAKEAQRLESLYKDRLTNVHQVSARRLHKARLEAYQENRRVLEELKRRSELEITAYRATMEEQVEVERRRFPELLPGIIEAMDRRVNAEGTLL
jgi:F0F1-type ATP synthase membrane subunit b/b'